MSTRPITENEEFRAKKTLEDLAREQGVKLGRPIEDFFAPDIWESDEEVEQFIKDTYEARRRDAEL